MKIFIALISNLAAIFASRYLVAGFTVSDDIPGLAMVVILMTIANWLILPMLRFIATPFSWLTFGLLPMALNGILIYSVDIISQSITINGLLPLIYTTVIFGVINALFALGAKALK